MAIGNDQLSSGDAICIVPGFLYIMFDFFLERLHKVSILVEQWDQSFVHPEYLRKS